MLILFQLISGVDITAIAKDLFGSDAAKFGVNKRPYRVVVKMGYTMNGSHNQSFLCHTFYYLAEEFIRGYVQEFKNHFRWDRVVANIPCEPDFGPSLPKLFKWNSQAKEISVGLVIYVDDLRTTGFSVENNWACTRQLPSHIQYLGIKDTSRKQRPNFRSPGPCAGGIL